MRALVAYLLLCLSGSIPWQSDHLPTYEELRASHVFPKWATTVCFTEKSTNEQMVLEEEPWNTKDATAIEFMLYGPKGDLEIQTMEYVAGKPIGYAKWERQKNSPSASNFTSIILGKNHHESTLMKLQLKWEPSPYFYIDLSSTSTGRPIMRAEGRCHPI